MQSTGAVGNAEAAEAAVAAPEVQDKTEPKVRRKMPQAAGKQNRIAADSPIAAAAALDRRRTPRVLSWWEGRAGAGWT